MQTAVETIIAKIKAVKPTQFCSIETILEWCEQAKEIEKQQIIDAVEDCRYGNGNEYYTDTYGSKGSDEHIVDTNKMISSQTEISDEEIILYAMNNTESVKMYECFLEAIKWYREQLKCKGNGETK